MRMGNLAGEREDNAQKNLMNGDHKEAEVLVVLDGIVTQRVDDVWGSEVWQITSQVPVKIDRKRLRNEKH